MVLKYKSYKIVYEFEPELIITRISYIGTESEKVIEDITDQTIDEIRKLCYLNKNR